ncbi:Hypothetical predicted protein [Podarcis lilfordi]|uniref:Uncharacterized protein n=1 Tax=Podarcis lilfordi TaxID=74358 RepID=A0AA35KH54_9SAUR|nr:Hypothetical predicted protein [Podarcis lilfordi]
MDRSLKYLPFPHLACSVCQSLSGSAWTCYVKYTNVMPLCCGEGDAPQLEISLATTFPALLKAHLFHSKATEAPWLKSEGFGFKPFS